MYRRPTTSFFDQDHSAKAKLKGLQKKNPLQTGEASKTNSAIGSSIPASSEAKSKLGAFAFKKSATEPSVPYTPIKAGSAKEDHNMPGPIGSRSAAPIPDPVKECPRTPVPRLPLSDLISIPEEGRLYPYAAQPDVSPEERIRWQMSPPSKYHAAQETPASKSKRQTKRPASSSPTSSPHVDTPAGKQRQVGVLKTPLADPAMQLWNKYSKNNKPSADAATPSSRLFDSEISQSVGAGGSPLVRRSYSCDPEWPQGKAKRRKTNPKEEGHELDEAMDVNGNRADFIGPGPSRLSRVSLLVDQVKEKLKESTMPSLPSSSSPLPDKGDYEPEMNSSPLGRAKARRPEALPEAEEKITLVCGDAQVENSDDDFGDFDDGDIDMEMLEKVEELVAQATQAKCQNEAADRSPLTPTKSVSSNLQQNGNENEDEFDEFDDGDDVFYNADFESVIAKYDTPEIPADIPVEQPVTQTQEESAPVVQNTIAAESAFADEFGDIDFDDWNEDEIALSNGLTDIKLKSIKRYLVIAVSESEWQWNSHAMRTQKALRVRDERLKVEKVILLRDSWFEETNVIEGDYLHLVGNFDRSGNCIVDNSHNMIILHPDFLVSSTVVADSFSCIRKAVMQDRIKATGDISKSMVYGNILHALFQMALEVNDFSIGFLHASIDTLVITHIESLYILREEVAIATDYLRSKIAVIQGWAQTFVSKHPKGCATVTDHRGSHKPIVAINKLLDIEEHVWSPMYGLKGNIDATVQATIRDNTGERTLTIPLELKTGKNSKVLMHRAQTMLYTLLMTDRYDIDVQCGLLYYMESSEMIRIPAIREELRGMIIGRNRLASYARNKFTLPDMARNKHACERCYAKTPCFLYHKLLEDGTPETSGVDQTFYKMTSHLGESHQKFFKHWDTLLSKEEKDAYRFRKELWTMLSSERELLGRCFGDLTIVPSSISVDGSISKINKYTYTFNKANPMPTFTFVESQINIGEPIVISDEGGHFALALGFVADIRRNRITVQVDRRLHNARTRQTGFNEKNNQVFAGIMEVSDGKDLSPTPTCSQKEQILYRLDKDEFSNGMALVRNNLIQLFSQESSSKYRKLIVDLEAPAFKISSTAYILDETSNQANLNEDQRRAIEKVMSAQDYALVLGMPGTGKTTTIAHIIRALVAQGKSVLLTSYTHTAVDNILLKIKKDNIEILRLGSGSKVHPDVKTFVKLAETPRNSFEELHDAFHTPKVVATTCLSINHTIFNERKFDYCIIDEASQITLPVCLGPIRMANTFILVGDHYQLPPLVKNTEARAGGLDISLFKLLSEAHPQAVVNLEHQYRMCREIMTLSNKLIYSGRLKCGNENVAKKTLVLPNVKALEIFHQSLGSQQSICSGRKCWMKDLFDEKVKACFVNTDTVPAREEKRGDRTNNPIEAQLAFQLVEGLLACGVSAESIGVISVYRSQIKTIQHLLHNRPTVEMHTADKFQGRDKEVIIISLVRSNENENIGDLLQDWRRINVAFTRARTKLIILGSKSTLQCNALLADFIKLMEENKWVYDLPPDAHLLHKNFELGSENSRTPKKGNKLEGPKRIDGKTMLAGRGGFLQTRPVLRDVVNGAL